MLDQTSSTRSQLKAAFTSVTKTADVAVEAGSKAASKQAGNAKTQVKAATTSVRKSAETVAEAATDTAN